MAPATEPGHALNDVLIEGVGEGACSVATAASARAGFTLTRAAMAADWVANLAMSSRRRRFLFSP